jgi:hypothetical protein
MPVLQLVHPEDAVSILLHLCRISRDGQTAAAVV